MYLLLFTTGSRLPHWTCIFQPPREWLGRASHNQVPSADLLGVSISTVLYRPVSTLLYNTCISLRISPRVSLSTTLHTVRSIQFTYFSPQHTQQILFNNNTIQYSNPPSLRSLSAARHLLVRHSMARAQTVSFNSDGNIVTTGLASERMARESLALLAELAELATTTDWEQKLL